LIAGAEVALVLKTMVTDHLQVTGPKVTRPTIRVPLETIAGILKVDSCLEVVKVTETGHMTIGILGMVPIVPMIIGIIEVAHPTHMAEIAPLTTETGEIAHMMEGEIHHLEEIDSSGRGTVQMTEAILIIEIGLCQEIGTEVLLEDRETGLSPEIIMIGKAILET
jgi:hypothetical protein